MRTHKILMLAIASISLTACSSMFGNVVPQSGPSMEQVYDGMHAKTSASQHAQPNAVEASTDTTELTVLRQNVKLTTPVNAQSVLVNADTKSIQQAFHKLPNPELVMYIYPHLAGSDQVPIPGYSTEFSVYEHDYYALSQEAMGS